MTEPDHEKACALIWRHWRKGAVFAGLPAGLAPATREDGYAIQACFEHHSSRPLAGWKIAATSAAGQAHINVDGPIAGRILAERVHENGAEVSLDGNRMRVCEPEFAFRIGADIPPRAAAYTVAEVMAKVADLHLALEFPDSRFADFTAVGGPSLIADNACGRDFVFGGAAPGDWRAMDLSTHEVTARVSGRYERTGSGGNVLGDPRVALAWLANELSALGLGLRRGELVSTGTCMPPLEVEPGDRVDADFGALGSVGVRVCGTDC
jgi:2-keto-4-pentenoate hydratase